jgi:hypothetical protein
VVQVPLVRLVQRVAANRLDGWRPTWDWPEDLGAAAVLRRYLSFLVAELDSDDGPA